MVTRITVDKIKALEAGDFITQPCEFAGELESAYQNAWQAKKELTDRDLKLSKSNVTMTVTIRRFK